MKTLTLAAALAAGLALSGCASLGGATDGETATQLLQNLRHCERAYVGGLGGLAPPMATINIRCPAEPYGPGAAPPPAAVPADAPLL